MNGSDSGDSTLGFQAGRHRYVLGRQLNSGGEGYGFEQRREVLFKIARGIRLQTRRAEMALQGFSCRRRNRHRNIEIARGLEAEIEILAQEPGRKCRGPIEI